MEIDHFLAVSQRPDLKADYDNLLLVCPICNVLKGSRALPDSCQVLTADTVVVDERHRQSDRGLFRPETSKRRLSPETPPRS
jgi:hypothetical protein